MALPASVPEEPIKAQLAYTEPPVIDLHGLSVSFGRRQILKNLRGDLRGKARHAGHQARGELADDVAEHRSVLLHFVR